MIRLWRWFTSWLAEPPRSEIDEYRIAMEPVLIDAFDLAYHDARGNRPCNWKRRRLIIEYGHRWMFAVDDRFYMPMPLGKSPTVAIGMVRSLARQVANEP